MAVFFCDLMFVFFLFPEDNMTTSQKLVFVSANLFLLEADFFPIFDFFFVLRPRKILLYSHNHNQSQQ